ncbi:MAG: hypothetical protein QXO51_03010 [Halobacteria archaeon]
MARIEGAGVILLAAVLLLAGDAAAKENLTDYLPGSADLAPLKLQPEKTGFAGARELQNTRCDTTAAAGAFVNVGLLLPPLAPGEERDNLLARVTLYRFNSSGEAAAFFQCMRDVRNRTRDLGTVGPAPYGDQGVVAENETGGATGASVLFIRGPYLVAADSLEEIFPSDKIHALAKMVDGRLAGGAAKAPGFEALGALGALAAVAWLSGRRSRGRRS